MPRLTRHSTINLSIKLPGRNAITSGTNDRHLEYWFKENGAAFEGMRQEKEYFRTQLHFKICVLPV